MNARIRESQAGKALFALAVLLALCVRVLIPTGFMPTASADGIVIQLCSDTGGKTLLVNVKSGTQGDKQRTTDGSCAFASGLGHGLIAPLDWAADLPFLYVLTTVAGRAIADLAVHRLAAPPPPSQGPPARA